MKSKHGENTTCHWRPLPALEEQSNHSDNEEMINLFQNQIDALEQEIQTLRRKQQGIKQSLTYQN